MAESTREWYLRAARELAATSPRQVEWCRGVADDPRVLAVLDAVPRPARQPSLLFAVAAYLGAPDAPYARWADAVLARAGDVVAELPRRRVQTNEPARCVPLVVALARIPGPIALVELGASAGLCLVPDRYSYRFVRPDGEAAVLGTGSPVLEAELVGAPPPEDLPEIRWRCGIDLAPVDLADADARRWLEASLPPDRPDRLERLRAAIASASRAAPRVVAGDALEELPVVAAQAPHGLTLVVACLGTAVYLPAADRARLVAGIRALGAHAVTFEARSAVPEVAARWQTLAADGRADADAAFLLALDGEPIASGSAHGDRLVSVRAAGRTGAGEVRS
ncbi:MAG: DUF2332 family protein [Protaetiibacter sp.]